MLNIPVGGGDLQVLVRALLRANLSFCTVELGSEYYTDPS